MTTFISPKKYLETYLTSFLKDKFTSDPDYAWTSDIETTKVSVVQEIPIRVMNYDIPIIVIGDARGRVAQSFIGDSYTAESSCIFYMDGVTLSSVFHRTYFVPHNMDIELSVLALKEDTVDEVSDRIASYLRFNRLELMQNGILPVTFDDADKGEEKIGDDLFKKGGVVLSDILLESKYGVTITGDILSKVTVEPTIIELDGTTL